MTKNGIQGKVIICMAAGLLILAVQAPAQTEKEEVRFIMTDPVRLDHGTAWQTGETFHVRDQMVHWNSLPVSPLNTQALKGVVRDLVNVKFAFNNQKYFGILWGSIEIETEEGGFWRGSFNGVTDRATGLRMGSAVCVGRGLYSGKKLCFHFTQRPGASPAIMDCYGTILDPGEK